MLFYNFKWLKWAETHILATFSGLIVVCVTLVLYCHACDIFLLWTRIKNPNEFQSRADQSNNDEHQQDCMAHIIAHAHTCNTSSSSSAGQVLYRQH